MSILDKVQKPEFTSENDCKQANDDTVPCMKQLDASNYLLDCHFHDNGPVDHSQSDLDGNEDGSSKKTRDNEGDPPASLDDHAHCTSLPQVDHTDNGSEMTKSVCEGKITANENASNTSNDNNMKSRHCETP